jgi:hypothetical protein
MEFIRTYFNAEKAESLLFIIAGAGAILFSLYLFIRIKRSFYTGLAFPLLFIGMIQVTAGTIIFSRSDPDKERVLNHMALEPERIHSEEIPRMALVLNICLLPLHRAGIYSHGSPSYVFCLFFRSCKGNRIGIGHSGILHAWRRLFCGAKRKRISAKPAGPRSRSLRAIIKKSFTDQKKLFICSNDQFISFRNSGV